ncbi:hypothetical protein FRB97_005183 [Tulasnella sp. 331]|nr:hypothetical protein FRB97_005183 [Tulasnella sp. 331]
MFSVPPPTDNLETYEDAAVVKLPDPLKQIRTLLVFMHGDIPFHPTFDTIESALRISHKYEVDRLHAWGIEQFRKYPKASDMSLTIYTHQLWPSYKDPYFLAKIIKLTEYIDNRELDTFAAVAFYALSVVDWQVHDPVPIFSSLSAEMSARLTRGRSKIISHGLDVIQGIVKHRCNGGPFLTLPPAPAVDQASEACQKAKDAALEALIPHLQGDFARALYMYFPALGVGNCVTVQNLVKGGMVTIFKSVAADFGFPNTTVAPTMHAAS